MAGLGGSLQFAQPQPIMLWLCVGLLLIRSNLAIDLRYLRRLQVVSSTESINVRNCTEPIWGDWYEFLPCNDNCGSCGTKVLRRRCITPDCPCIGSSRRQVYCFIGVCDYPRPACCPPFKITYYNGNFGCGPQEQEIVAEFLNQSFIGPTTLSNPPFQSLPLHQPLASPFRTDLTSQ